MMKRLIAILLLALSLLFSLFTAASGFGNLEWKPRLQVKLPGKATVLAYSSDGSRLAVGHADGQVDVWEVKTGTLVRQWAAHTKEVNSVQFYAGDTRLLTMGDENRARLWSTADWTELGSIDGPAFSGGISPDNRWLAAQDPGQAIWVWDLSSLKPVKQLLGKGQGGTQHLAFTADSKSIATAYQEPLFIVVETKQQAIFASPGDKKTDTKIMIHGDKMSVSMGTLRDDDAITHTVIPSRSGTLVALGRGWYGKSAFVDVWDMSAMKRLGRFKPNDSGTTPSFSFDNNWIAINGAAKATIWSIADGKQVASVKGNGMVQFSPNSLALAVTHDETLIIYTPK